MGLLDFLFGNGENNEQDLSNYGLDEDEKRAMEKDDYDYWNFEEEELEDDDYYAEDDEALETSDDENF